MRIIPPDSFKALTMVTVLCLSGPVHAEGAAQGDAIRAIEPVAIFRDSARYATFPDVKRLPDGRLLCVFRDAPFPDKIKHIEVDARIVGAVSRDGGRTWSRPEEIHACEVCHNDPSVCVLRDGRLLLTYFTWVGMSEEEVREQKPFRPRQVDRGAWGKYAVCGGVHALWGDARSLVFRDEPVVFGHGGQGLMATSCSVLETAAGTLLLPAYGRSETSKADQAFVWRSTDAGRTWGEPALMASTGSNIAQQEPALVQAANGDIVALLRTTNAEDHLYLVRSADDGRTWNEPERTELVGHPADLVRLPDDRLLAVYGYRHEPYGVRGCVSDDHGRTWLKAREIVIADRGAHTDLGYPSVCLTDDGHVFVAYYMNGPDTRDRWIEGKRIPLALLR